MKSQRKIRFGQFFGIVIFSVVVIFTGVATAIQIFRDFKQTKETREKYQRVVSELALKSLRAPLIQGSFVEARLRASSISQSPQVYCVSIQAKDVPVVDCGSQDINVSKLYRVTGTIYYDEAQVEPAATVTVVFDNSDIYQGLQQKIIFAVATNSLLALLVLGVLLFASRVINRDLKYIIKECEGEGTSRSPLFLAEFDYLQKQIRLHMNAAKSNAEIRAAGEIARQVKHDIRSPLAALNMIVRSLVLPSEKKGMIQSAISRINEIADDLTSGNQTHGSVRNVESKEKEAVGDIASSLVDEKRLQYRERPEVLFDIVISPDAYEFYPDMCVKDLKRAMSNVLNNSVEAVSGPGLIKVSITKGPANLIRIVIVDNGKGIPPNIISTLGVKGTTFGKVNGSGLGLNSALVALESIGGSLLIDSDGMSGTCVEMLVPVIPFQTSIVSNISQ